MEKDKKVYPTFESKKNAPINPRDLDLAYDFKEMMEALPAAIYLCNPDGKISFYNEAAAALWGRKPQLGEDRWCGCHKIFSANGMPLELDNSPMAITLKEGIPLKDTEIIIERPDGSRVNVLPHPKPLFNSSGRLLGAIIMLEDISEKKEKEKRLYEIEKRYLQVSDLLSKSGDERTLHSKLSEERYHKMVEEVQDYAILLLDPEGNILNWNKGAQRIKGYSEEEILGKNIRIFYTEEDRIAKLPETLIREAAEKGKAMHEGWRLRKNGSKFWGSIVITALHDDLNQIIGFSKVTRDLTDKKLADDQLKQYTRDIEFQNSQLEEYAYVASHDLQEPLRKIQIFTELLERNLEDKAEARKYLDKINSASIRMTNLIRDVLQYSQLSPDAQPFVPTDLNEVLIHVEEDFEILIQETHCNITYSKLPVIPGIPIQLQQLFSNLISNSLKFTHLPPVIEISAHLLSAEEVKNYSRLNPDLSYLQILYKDNGIGFEPQYAEQVFKLFNRLHHDKSGTGIGLALCKRIVENHRGMMSVLSEVDKGTSFFIILPSS